MLQIHSSSLPFSDRHPFVGQCIQLASCRQYAHLERVVALTVKLLMIGGVESNPGPASDEVSPDRASPAAPGEPVSEDDLSAARAAPQLPSLEVSEL
jgi:hypothetical protein